MKPILIHAGMAKSFSTSLQGMLTASNNKAFTYLGYEPSAKPEDWYSHPLLSRLLNLDLRFSNNSAFRQYESTYRNFFVEQQKTRGPIILSSENLTVSLVPGELDIEDKFSRLGRLLDEFKPDIFLIFRPQVRVIRSFYKEFVKQGYTESFDYFQSEAVALFDCGFLPSLLPGYVLSSIRRGFPGVGKIYVWFADNDSTLGLADFFTQLYGQQVGPLPKLNASREASLQALLDTNGSEPAFIDSTGILETHRLLWHQNPSPAISWGKLRARRRARETAVHSKNQSQPSLEPTAELLAFLESKIKLDYKEFMASDPIVLSGSYESMGR